MTKIKTYHVTGRLQEVLKTDQLLAKCLTVEIDPNMFPGEDALEIYNDYLNRINIFPSNSSRDNLADDHFEKDRRYINCRRQTHIYFTNNPFYVLDKVIKRRKTNLRQNLPISDVAVIELTLDTSEIRTLKPHIMVTNSLPNLNNRILAIYDSYPEFLFNYLKDRLNTV
jgi:hypothetical protein